MKDARILFDGVWKKFHRGEHHDSLRDLIPALARRMVGRGPERGALQQGDFWAVRDLSFEVLPGQTLGIIGGNGSGKSTTLKLLTKILEPTRGYSEVRGRVGALIEISAGFHGDLTGRENVYLQGAIMGMPQKEIARKFDDIVDFSGVGDFLDTPVKRYSSGMNARLGFSIAAHLEPEVLIIDEVLAVGDMAFQDRAFGRIRDLAKSGIPVIIVSHQLDRVTDLCSEVILLRSGVPITRGLPDEVVSFYVQNRDATSRENALSLVSLDAARVGDDEEIVAGRHFNVRVEGDVHGPLTPDMDPLLINVRSLRTGMLVFRTSSRSLGVDLREPGPFSVDLELQANLPAGGYAVEFDARDVATQRNLGGSAAVKVMVTDPGTSTGPAQLNPSLRVRSPR